MATVPDLEVNIREQGKRKVRRNSGRPLVRLMDRVFGRPLCITEEKADVIVGVLAPRMGLIPDSMPALMWDDEDMADPEEDEPPYSVAGGVAYIPIQGTLVKRASGMDARSGLTSYEKLGAQIKAAAIDPAVQGIILDVDSGGGEADGMFDLADEIMSIRGSKPMFAVCDGMMCSAAYALGCCADQIYTTRTGTLGSIGCFMLFVDQSGYDKQKGLKYTFIQAGKLKTQGNPHEPLDGEAKAEFQSEVDRIRDMFVTHVARARGVTAQQVLDTEAGVFFGENALPLLADKMGTCDQAMADMLTLLAKRPPLADDPTDPPGDMMQAAMPAMANGGTVLLGGKITVGAGECHISELFIDGTRVDHSNWTIMPGAINGLPVTLAAPAPAAHHYAIDARGIGSESVAANINMLIPATRSVLLDQAFVDAAFRSVSLYSRAFGQGGNGHAEFPYSEKESIALFGQKDVVLAVRGFGKRSATTPSTGRKISMLVAPYDGVLSTNLGGYREVYQRGAFAQGLDNDPRMLFNHDEACVLGRKSAGTSRFWEDAAGVHAEADAPETSWADDLLVSMRRGDISQASAAFWILQQRWETRDGEKVRIVEKALLREASVYSFPAYETTTATAQQQAAMELPAFVAADLWKARLALLRLR